MRIETKKLYDFIKKSTLNGSITTTYIDIDKDGMKSRVKDISNICLTNVSLKEDISNENMYGRIYIRNSPMFLQILKTFGDFVELTKKDEYTLLIKGEDVNRKADIIMGSDLIVDNIIEKELPNIPIVREFGVNKKVFSRVLSDVSMLKINEVTMKTDKDKFLFIVGSEKESDVLSTFIDIESGDEVNVTVGTYIKDLSDSLDGDSDVRVKIGTNVPAIFEEKSGNMEFTCIIAPIVKN